MAWRIVRAVGARAARRLCLLDKRCRQRRAARQGGSVRVRLLREDVRNAIGDAGPSKNGPPSGVGLDSKVGAPGDTLPRAPSGLRQRPFVAAARFASVRSAAIRSPISI